MTTQQDSTNKYCVPTALAILMGTSIEVACAHIRNHLGEQPITGIYHPIILRILRDNGYEVREKILVNECRTSLIRLVRLISSSTWLVILHGHVLVYKNGMVFDNAFPTGVLTEFYPLRSAKVEGLFLITKLKRENAKTNIGTIL